MKKNIFVLLIAIAFSTSISAQWSSLEKIKGNGNEITKTVTTTPYEKIQVSGFFNVVIVTGQEGNITLKGDENLLNNIDIEVLNETLQIGVKKGKYLVTKGRKEILITVPFQTINEVSLSGSGAISTKNPIRCSEFRTMLSGSGTIELLVEAKDITSKVSGSGDIVLKGKSENFNCEITGSGDITTTELESLNVEASITGSGNCKVFCTDFLQARITGSGDLEYKGNPKKKDTKVTGSGSISKA